MTEADAINMEKDRNFWNSEKIRFFRDAGDNLLFNRELADRMMKYMDPEDHVCDVACGLGYLTLELADMCRRVTAADISHEALGVLRDNLERSPKENVDVIEGDVFAMPEDLKFDTMIFNHFGKVREIVELTAKHGKRNSVMVRKNWKYHRFADKKVPITHLIFSEDCRTLDEMGIPYRTELFQIDMGQPLRSLDEAMRFFRLYNKSGKPESITMEDVLAKIEKTDLEEFPYYMPSKKESAFIIINADEVRDIIKRK